MRRSISKFHTIVALAVLAFAIYAGNACASVTLALQGPPPPPPYTSLTNVTKVVAGSANTLALKSDGTVWAWGYNVNGELGDGTSATKLSPVQVPGLTNGTTIAAGYFHFLAVKSDGTVWTWGWNQHGQLGDGSTTNRTAPVQVTGLTGVVAIAAGWGHSFAVKSDGTVWAWGNNDFGQLGDGTTIERHTPVQVTGLTGVVAVADTVALKSNGTVWAWGANDVGQVGDGTDVERHTPVQVIGLTGITAIASGGAHFMAIKNDGTLWGWGWNIYGQLGDGTTTNRHTAVQINGVSGVTHIAAGALHTVVRKSDGFVYAWGYNEDGELGNGSIQGSLTPLQVNVAYAYSVAAGGFHSLAVTENGIVRGWGWNVHGQVGDGTTASRTRSVLAGGLSGRSIGPGGFHALAVKTDGSVWGWGDNLNGQIGDGTTVTRVNPVQVKEINQIIAVSSGMYHSLALKADGTVWAWGDNVMYGQLGDGSNISRSTPVQVSNLSDVMGISAGENHSLALKTGGTVWAWGANYGRLGDGTYANQTVPVQVRDLSDVIEISAGAMHSLALKSDGSVWAWGENRDGRLGDGTKIDRITPVMVNGLTQIIAISAGRYHSLALKQDGSIWAWGGNGEGELGDGTYLERITPIQVFGLQNMVAISAGTAHSMALNSNGTIWTWGWNSAGQLGDGSVINRTTPVQVSGISNSAALATGMLRSFAIVEDGTVWAWGFNGGSLGDGSYIEKILPVEVKLSTGQLFNLTVSTVPDAFNFTAQSGVAVNTPVISNSITVSGITAASPISIVGGEYTLDSGVTWTSAPATVFNNTPIWVRLTSSSSYSTTTSATLTIGGVSGTFSVTTAARDITPNQFSFTAVTGASINTLIESNAVVISGINDAAPMTITGQGEYSVNGGAWTSNPGTASNGDSVKVRLMSSGSYLTTVDTKLVINGVQGTFIVTTTVPPGTAPDAFSFPGRTLVPADLQITSDPVTISGINVPSPISIIGGEYRIGDGAWTSAPGSVINGQAIRVRQTSSTGFNTTTTATLTIGGVSADFALTTVSAGTEILHTAWWSTNTGYAAYVMVQNTTNNPVTVNAALIGRNGVTYIPTPLTLSPKQARSIVINSSQANLLGAVNGAVEVTHNGNPGDIVADLMVFNNGFSLSTGFKKKTATTTTLHAPWWSTNPGYTSYVMVKNTTNTTVTVNATLLGRNGTSYTPSLTLAPHQARSIVINSYQANLPGAVNGAVELTHTGNPGDVVGDLIVFGPSDFSLSTGLKENVATSTTLHAPWWSTNPGYSSYVMVKNTSNSTITVNATLLGRNGTSYTPSLTLAPHQARSIVVNSYQDNLPGAVNGAVELTHTGNPGDIVGDLIVFGPSGFSLSTDLREDVAPSTTLYAPWWSTNLGYTSYVMVKNTSNSTITVNATLLGRNGTSYTPSLILAPHQARSIVVNSYQANLPGAVNGAVEVTHTGNPGDIVGDLIVFGPSGFSLSAPLR